MTCIRPRAAICNEIPDIEIDQLNVANPLQRLNAVMAIQVLIDNERRDFKLNARREKEYGLTYVGMSRVLTCEQINISPRCSLERLTTKLLSGSRLNVRLIEGKRSNILYETCKESRVMLYKITLERILFFRWKLYVIFIIFIA
jgi:hypothetical protein